MFFLICNRKEHFFLRHIYIYQQICVLTHDVVHAERTGAVLHQPGIHTVSVELMSTRDDPHILAK